MTRTPGVRVAGAALACMWPAFGGCGGDPTAGGPDPRGEASGAVATSPSLDVAGQGLELFEEVTERVGIVHRKAIGDGDGDTRDLIAASVCVVDVDGEGPLDLFFPLRLAGGVSSRLYVGAPNGSWVDETAERGLMAVGDALGCLAFDADGDRDQDLLVVGVGLVQLYLNDAGVFSDASEDLELGDRVGPRHLYVSSAAGDFDGDEDIDVVIGGYVDLDPVHWPEGERCRTGIPCDTDPGWSENIPNLLLIRDSDGRYREQAAIRVAGADGLATRRPTLTMVAMDIDLDGVVEILVGNDFRVSDQVFRRNRGSELFLEVGSALALDTTYRGFSLDSMGWATGDLDGDGVEDHVVTGFEDESSAVHLSTPNFVFEDAAPTIGVRDRRHTFRWGPALVDLDLDGDLDLVEATGHFYRESHFEPGGYDGPVRQPTNVFENVDGELRAIETSPADPLSVATDARGIAVADLDDDGRPDLVLADATGAPQVLRNRWPVRGRYLRVTLEGRAPNTEGVGARVEVYESDSRPLGVRHKKVGEGYGGCFDPRLLFGLQHDGPVRLEVQWPDGTRTVHREVEVDGDVVVTQ